MRHSNWLPRPVFLAFGLIWLTCCLEVPGQTPAANPAQLRLLQANHRDLQANYFESLRSLQKYCLDQGLEDGIQEIGRYLAISQDSRLRLSDLPHIVEKDVPLDLAPEARHWRTQLKFQRQEHAKQLYLLSRKALHGGFTSYAMAIVRELIQQDPDHAKARELLGYSRLGDEWLQPFPRKMKLKGYEWTTDFGWLPKSHVPRYQKGERYVNGRWMSADKEAAIRQDFQYAWEIQTDHYIVRTNYSLERGVELGRALEDFYEFFHQTFAAFFDEPEQLQKIFNGASRGDIRNPKQYLVHFYRTREEYVSRLQAQFPSIQATNGIYLTGDRTAHFYFDAQGAAEDTLFHEATHQLFYESHLLNRPIAEQANFWIVEGIACYFESFRRDNGTFTIGDPGHIRFAGARMNYIDKEFYVPLREFTAMGSTRFQSLPSNELPRSYTQAAGLAHFFMEYENGIYRDAVVSHLSQIYSADARRRQNAAGLDVLTGLSYEDLDRQYGVWMNKLRAADIERLTTSGGAP